MADGTRPDTDSRRVDWWAKVLGLVVAVYGLAFFFVRSPISAIDRSVPFDLDINLVGARRMLEGRDLYDAAASRAEGVRHVSKALRYAYHETFSSFVGAPVIAALHTPFTYLARSDAVTGARLLNLVCVVAAVVLVVAALPRRSRVVGALVGTGALALSQPLIAATGLGQLHGLVMLGLAAGIWGAATGRWVVAGIGLGAAAVLKVSPVLLILYLAFRVGRRVVVPAVATAASLCAFAALVGSPSALLVWIRDVAPSLSGGTRYIRNQSVPAFLARLTGSPDIAKQAALGGFRFVGPLLALGLAYLVFRSCRRRDAVLPIELGALVLVLLVAGPLSWDHYYVWAVLALVSACDLELWTNLTPTARRTAVVLCALALLALTLPIPESQRAEVAAHWGLRVTTSPYVLAGVLLLAVAGLLLASARPRIDGGRAAELDRPSDPERSTPPKVPIPL
jgi:hypothetical protein